MTFDYCIVGGGIIGLTSAFSLIQKDKDSKILILEKESQVSFHQSGHNSGVVHSGIYYPTNSLKSTLCVEGSEAIKKYCHDYDLPLKRIGKLIVASSEKETKVLNNMSKRALDMNLTADLIDGKHINKFQEGLKADAFLHLPDTCITSYSRIAKHLAGFLKSKGVIIKLNHEVIDITQSRENVRLKCQNEIEFKSKKLAICGGINSDRLAKMTEFEIDFQILPIRGDYFVLKNYPFKINHLIYPTPDPNLPFLGIHLTPTLENKVLVGPNAILNFSRDTYSNNSFSFKDMFEMSSSSSFWKFLNRYKKFIGSELLSSIFLSYYADECRKYLKDMNKNHLVKYTPGIRAQAIDKTGNLIMDFKFLSSDRILHVCNAPSPAATSSFPIGEKIANKLIV